MEKTRSRFYFVYTVLFILFAALAFLAFFSQGRSFIWCPDGLYQHYNAFVYYGEWLRGIVRTLVCGHRLEVPLWEFGIGYGSDVIHTLSYYVIGDPFALISAFVPASCAEAGYTAALMLRFYAAGLAFCAFSRKMGAGSFAALAASMMYLFCAYTYVAIRHPYFIGPMIYLPLLLLGAEKILRKERPYGFIFAVFLAAVSNFYFFYMLVLFTALYVLLRLLCGSGKRRLGNLVRYLAAFLGFGAVGVMMAAVLFLPVAMNFLSNTRISDVYQYPPFYSRFQYEMLVGSFVGIKNATEWNFPGMVPLALLGVGAVIMERGQYLWLGLFTACLFVFMLFPFMGHVFNGFGYVTNRWIFAWLFAGALCFALGFPVLLRMGRKRKLILAGAAVGYTLLCVALPKTRTLDVLVGCAFLLAFTALVLFYGRAERFWPGGLRVSRKAVFQAALLGLMGLCVFVQSRGRYVYRKYAEEFLERGTADEMLNGQRAKVWRRISDDSFYRIDNAMVKNRQLNYALCSGQSTTTMFWSLVNPRIVEYLQANCAYSKSSYNFRGLASRSWLLPPAAVKYYVSGSKKTQQATVPYPFEPLGGRGASTLYQTDASLPFGYTFDGVLTEGEFQELTVAERQQAMLQGAVIRTEDMGEAALLPPASLVYTDRTLPFELRCGEGVEISGNTIVTTKEQADVTLYFDCPAECELYVQLEGLEFEGTSPYGNAAAESRMEPSDETVLTARCAGAVSSVTHYTSRHKYAHGRRDYLLNLYYSASGRMAATVTFSERGSYTFDRLTVVAQPMEGLTEYVDAAREDVLEHVEMTANAVSGEIILERDKLLCLSLPYAEGWQVRVDAKPAKLLCTNLMYSGVVLGEGRHLVELNYRTPYLTEGWVVTLFGFGIFILLWRTDKRREEQA